MSASANPVHKVVPRELRFPFDHILLSKDRIPFPSTVKEDYFFQGAGNASMGQARGNCCWIEVSMHLLSRDPFIRYFITDYRDQLEAADGAMPVRVSDPPYEYIGGALLMKVLAARLKMRNYENKETSRYNIMIEPYYKELRNHFEPDWRKGDQMGEVDNFMTYTALPSLRTFIAFHWSGSVFQQHYLAYGCAPVVRWTESCAGRSESCPLRKVDRTMYNSNGCSLRGDANPLNMTDASALTIMHASAAPVVVSEEEEDEEPKAKHMLSDVIGELEFAGKWEFPLRGSQCQCGETRIVKKVLTTLPWMLYINMSRPRAAAGLQTPIFYDPDSLTLGPTADGQYATYRLVCRARYTYLHFKADIRENQGKKWKTYNFDYEPVDIRCEGEQSDTTSTMLLWERKE